MAADPALYLVGNIDARVWADAFCEIFEPVIQRREDDIEFSGAEAHELLFTWFANAIESGRMTEQEHSG